MSFIQASIPEFSVTELAGAVRQALETAFGRVRVRGEIGGLRRHGSGHCYLCLKDGAAKLDAVIWRSAVPRLGMAVEDGLDVIATGRVTTYPDRSTYQLIIDRLEYAGVGAILARIERLRAMLAEEGLFAAERKRALPLLPRVVGVVTSESGAVIQDIVTTIHRRLPVTVLLWPVPVQGEAAAPAVVAALAGLGALEGSLRPEVIIVARGGGSVEELLPFSDEAVARAVVACPIPVISAVGHETDTTLIDLAADLRAPTPTAAAEIAVPSRLELTHRLDRCGAVLAAGLGRTVEACRHATRTRLPDFGLVVLRAMQAVDDRAARLRRAAAEAVAARRALVGDAARVLRADRPVGHARAWLAGVAGRFGGVVAGPLARDRQALALAARGVSAPVPRAVLERATGAVAALAARLDGAGPMAPLARGYALVRDGKGRLLMDAATATKAARLRIMFADGTVEATVPRGKAAGQGRLAV